MKKKIEPFLLFFFGDDGGCRRQRMSDRDNSAAKATTGGLMHRIVRYRWLVRLNCGLDLLRYLILLYVVYNQVYVLTVTGSSYRVCPGK